MKSLWISLTAVVVALFGVSMAIVVDNSEYIFSKEKYYSQAEVDEINLELKEKDELLDNLSNDKNQNNNDDSSLENQTQIYKDKILELQNECADLETQIAYNSFEINRLEDLIEEGELNFKEAKDEIDERYNSGSIDETNYNMMIEMYLSSLNSTNDKYKAQIEQLEISQADLQTQLAEKEYEVDNLIFELAFLNTELYEVKFMIEDAVYNKQIVKANDCVILPTTLTYLNGHPFLGWSIDGTNIIENIEELPVSEDIVYVAVYDLNSVTFQ